MQMIQPKELEGKLKYRNNDVFIRDGITLTEHEMEIYRRFRQSLREAFLARFEE